MTYDGAYRPDRRIQDIYKEDWEAKRIAEMGLPPYARIGSLADWPARSEVNYGRRPKHNLNRHKFTFIAPLRGANLSPVAHGKYLAAPPISSRRIQSPPPRSGIGPNLT